MEFVVLEVEKVCPYYTLFVNENYPFAEKLR